MLAELQGVELGIRRLVLDGGEVRLDAEVLAQSVRCPACGVETAAIHDRYVRRPRDLPWRGYRVRVALTVRRFRCRNRACPRATFTEPLGPKLPRWARRTAPATTLLRTLALSAGGEAGARLAHAAGLPASPDTLLRVLRQMESPAATPRVLGVDDFALRRRKRYGTILVDLETHRPVDLLLGREAEVLATWLRAHPGVEVVVRDRAEAYAQGARQGAPTAQQVADRFHLVQNATAALDGVLRTRHRQAEIAATPVAGPEAEPTREGSERPLSPTKQHQLARRQARVDRWERVRSLAAVGVSRRRIAEEVGVNRRTVQRLLATPEPPRNQRQHPRPGGLTSPTLQPYVGYLQERWQQGCTNVSQLFREILAQGYTGSRTLLSQALQPWRPPRGAARGRRCLKRLEIRQLCLQPPESLTGTDRDLLAQVLAADPELAAAHGLLQAFRQTLASGDAIALQRWIDAALASPFVTFQSFAKGLLADRAAVEAAVTSRWSNGPVEGHVHRLKLIKRQGYGRAGLALLRRRVLAS